jgi:hypothetical protein
MHFGNPLHRFVGAVRMCRVLLPGVGKIAEGSLWR